MIFSKKKLHQEIVRTQGTRNQKTKCCNALSRLNNNKNYGSRQVNCNGCEQLYHRFIDQIMLFVLLFVLSQAVSTALVYPDVEAGNQGQVVAVAPQVPRGVVAVVPQVLRRLNRYQAGAGVVFAVSVTGDTFREALHAVVQLCEWFFSPPTTTTTTTTTVSFTTTFATTTTTTTAERILVDSCMWMVSI